MDLASQDQQYTSAKTCRKQIPALHRVLLRTMWKPGDVNADIGGGKWDLVTEELAKAGVQNIVYDPYNRDASWNETAMKVIQNGGLSTATVSNVLNVIAEPQIRSAVIQMAASISRRVFFSVYEGNRSGQGKRTRDGWQENRSLESYLKEISHFFDKTRIRRNGGLSFITTEN